MTLYGEDRVKICEWYKDKKHKIHAESFEKYKHCIITWINNDFYRILKVESKDERLKLEKKFIALFSHCNQCKIHCKTSSEWLGSFAYDPKVRCSGLWNDHHVCSKDEFTEDGLNRLLELAKATPNSDQKRLNDLEKELQKHKDCSEHTEN